MARLARLVLPGGRITRRMRQWPGAPSFSRLRSRAGEGAHRVSDGRMREGSAPPKLDARTERLPSRRMRGSQSAERVHVDNSSRIANAGMGRGLRRSRRDHGLARSSAAPRCRHPDRGLKLSASSTLVASKFKPSQTASYGACRELQDGGSSQRLLMV